MVTVAQRRHLLSVDEDRGFAVQDDCKLPTRLALGAKHAALRQDNGGAQTVDQRALASAASFEQCNIKWSFHWRSFGMASSSAHLRVSAASWYPKRLGTPTQRRLDRGAIACAESRPVPPPCSPWQHSAGPGLVIR